MTPTLTLTETLSFLNKYFMVICVYMILRVKKMLPFCVLQLTPYSPRKIKNCV